MAKKVELEKAEVVEEVSAADTTFSKSQFIESKKYGHRKDILQTLLEEDKQYTSKEVDELVEKYLNRKVE